jgi:hypothetical protein
MQGYRWLVLMGLLLGFGSGQCGAQTGTPFAITAVNLTMPSVTVITTTGGATSIPLGSSAFTVTGIPGAGTLTISCQYSGPDTVAKIPQVCGHAGVPGVPIEAGETTLSGIVYFVPYGFTSPSVGELRGSPRPSSHLPAAGLALAGALMVGFGLRRRGRSWLALAVFAVGGLAGAMGISACSGGGQGMTPGTYQYTILAGFQPSDTNVIADRGTTITLRVR